ncbi:hypothetical protein U8V72_14490 [Priestia filamentosa]|uniref:hypothetical protein n=1 Tax=Priestia filamentosa TaxID=1402861 RepID=UPI000588FD03
MRKSKELKKLNKGATVFLNSKHTQKYVKYMAKQKSEDMLHTYTTSLSRLLSHPVYVSRLLDQPDSLKSLEKFMTELPNDSFAFLVDECALYCDNHVLEWIQTSDALHEKASEVYQTN